MKRSRIKRKPPRSGSVPNDVRETVLARSKYRCEGAIAGVCTGVAEELHHRQPRGASRNPHTVSNCVYLCSACHRHVTDVSPREGFDRGLRVSRHTVRPPGEFPMLLCGRRWVLLDDAGGWVYVEI